MAFYEACVNISLVPDAATTVSTFASLDSSGNATLATDPTDTLVGVFAETVPLGLDSVAVVAPVTISGVAMISVGSGGVTAGNMVSTDAAGKAVAASSTGGDNIVGPVLVTGAEDDIVPILMNIRTVNA